MQITNLEFYENIANKTGLAQRTIFFFVLHIYKLVRVDFQLADRYIEDKFLSRSCADDKP